MVEDRRYHRSTFIDMYRILLTLNILKSKDVQHISIEKIDALISHRTKVYDGNDDF